MQINYPANYEVGDIVFTAIGSALFREIASASNCWSNHVGMIIGHDGRDYIVAESRIPLSSTTTLNRFIRRSAGQRHCVRRLSGGLTMEQKQALLQQVPSRLHKVYHTGFNYDSSRQFCSKFVFDIYQEALSMQIGSIENFDELLRKNPQAKLTFWKFWFIGAIPWSRNTVTPASLWRNQDLSVVYRSHSDMQP